jgi:hypothetical protein
MNSLVQRDQFLETEGLVLVTRAVVSSTREAGHWKQLPVLGNQF